MIFTLVLVLGVSSLTVASTMFFSAGMRHLLTKDSATDEDDKRGITVWLRGKHNPLSK